MEAVLHLGLSRAGLLCILFLLSLHNSISHLLRVITLYYERLDHEWHQVRYKQLR